MTEIILFLFVIVCHQFGSGIAEVTCGVPNSGEILDGCHDAEPHQFPWHVQMTMCGYTCGGTVISIFSNFLNKTVEIRLYLSISVSLCLSASHCISVVVCASLCLFVCLSVSLCPVTIQRTFQKSVNDTRDLSACK